MNAIYAAGWGILADLALTFDPALASLCRQSQARVEDAIMTNMWNSTLNRFVSTYKNPNGETVQTPVESVQSLFPLLLESLPKAQQVSVGFE